jgi:pyridoxine 4-dehydrogenase
MTGKLYTVAGHQVGATGFGLLGLTWQLDPSKEPHSEEDALAAMKAAVDNGANFWNSGDFYGMPDRLGNLKIIRKYFDRYPEDADKVLLSVKGGINKEALTPDGSAKSIAKTIQNVKDILGDSKKLDMFTLARVGTVPIEESVRAIVDHINRGDIDSYCLSETSVDTIRRAHKIRPIDAIEIEVSLWSREAEFNGVFATCKELNIPVVAYSPVGRGFLTGHYKSKSDIPAQGILSMMDRTKDGAIEHNFQLLHKIQEIADHYNCTPSQIALSWVRDLSDDATHPIVIPIPGTTKVARVVENCSHVTLSKADADDLASFLDSFHPIGGRYWEDAEENLYK